MKAKIAITLIIMIEMTLPLMRLGAQATAPVQAPATPWVEPPADTSSPPATEVPRPEDWTTISLEKSQLPLWSTGGVPLSKVELPGCTRELLRMQWRFGDPIDLYVIRPLGVARPPVVLYLFNYTADEDRFRGDDWCSRVQQNGMAAAGFVSALAGQRFHAPRPMKEWFVSELQEALASSTHDVQMVLNYLAKRDDLDMTHVGMVGHGSGGAIAILAAAADRRIIALDLIDPWGDWPDWLKESKQIPEQERDAYLKPAFLRKVSTLDPVNYLAQLKDRALRIEQVTEDAVTPPAARDKIAAAAPRADEVVRFPDRALQARAWAKDDFSGWLAQRLKPSVTH